MNKGWAALLCEIFNKTKLGISSPGPFFYFISIIILAGGVGVWLPLVQYPQITPTSIMTYIFALLSALMADFFTQNENRSSASKDFSIFIISIVVFIICLTVLSLQSVVPHWLILIPLFFTWWLWWLLLEESKFDISPKQVEESTIGRGRPEGSGESKSLAALKAEKEKSRG